MSNTPRLLNEAAVGLIVAEIKQNITSALQNVRGYWNDSKVTTESPPSTSYFIYPKAHGYQCPAIFVIDDTTDFRQAEKQSNFVNARMSINVSVKVEDRDQWMLTVKAWRYMSALHAILEQANLASVDGAVKLVVKVKRVKPGFMYTIENAEPDTTVSFFKEYELLCEVDFFEGL